MRKLVLLATLATLAAACTPTTGTYVPSSGGGSGGYGGGEVPSVTQDRSGTLNPGETVGPDTGGGFGPIRG
jgi:hypothetical protein